MGQPCYVRQGSMGRIAEYSKIKGFSAKALLQGFDQTWGSTSILVERITWESLGTRIKNARRELGIFASHLVGGRLCLGRWVRDLSSDGGYGRLSSVGSCLCVTFYMAV